MKAVAAQSTSEGSPSRKQKAAIRPAQTLTCFTRPAVTINGGLIYRKPACACGGSGAGPICSPCRVNRSYPSGTYTQIVGSWCV